MFGRAIAVALALTTAACGARPHADAAADAARAHRDRGHPLARIASDDERARTEAYSELTAMLNRGPLPREEVAPYANDVQRQLDEHLDRAAPAQRPEPITCGSWGAGRAYVMLRWETELLLDLGGSVPGGAMRKSLERATGLSDARLRYFAVRSLLLRGDALDAKLFGPIAAVDEVRGKLFSLLSERGRRADFPAEYATQEALARSRLVDWLQWDQRFGCVPRRIELGAVVPVGDDDWFVFRFSTDGSKRSEHDMLAGVAGPYAHASEPTLDGGDRTGSGFEPFDAKSPEEHVRAASADAEQPPTDADGTSI